MSPHYEHDKHSLKDLWTSVEKIPINWSNKSPSDTCRFKDLYDNFTENMINNNLEQMVKIPIRNNNILIYFSPTYQVKFMKPKRYQDQAHQITIQYFTKSRSNGVASSKIPDRSNHTKRLIVMDFSKAFDKVDHHKFVHKLKHMGVNPYITTWI